MYRYICSATKVFENLIINSQKAYISPVLNQKPNTVRNCLIQHAVRNTSFFTKLPASHLWKGVTSVSNAGKKRGRGKNVSKRNIKNLNKGQIIGVGKANIIWPGLSSPVIRGKELVQQQQLPEDPEREKRLIALRDTMGGFRRYKLSPLERGWSGSRMPGRSIGPPDPIGEDKFQGFDTKVLELKIVWTMKGNFGRKRRQSALVITGNGNGLAGFAQGRAQEPSIALRKAKNRAAQKLVHIKMFRNHTVCHHFFTEFGNTRIYVWQKPEGYGLKCHRAIKTICEVLGIKDLYAKVEGSTNVNHVTKAFFCGLIQQKTPEEMAEEKKLHLVEFSNQSFNYPKIIASPQECREAKDIPKDEVLEFVQHCFGGKVVLQKKPKRPFYEKLDGYIRYLKKYERRRNQDKVRINLRAEYGNIRSFLADKYPECVQFHRKPKNEATEEVTDN